MSPQCSLDGASSGIARIPGCSENRPRASAVWPHLARHPVASSRRRPAMTSASTEHPASCNPLPSWLVRLRARFPGFAARYLELDPRSLGLARIYLGCLLLLEVVRHIPFLAPFYTDEGLLPRAPVWNYGGE